MPRPTRFHSAEQAAPRHRRIRRRAAAALVALLLLLLLGPRPTPAAPPSRPQEIEAAAVVLLDVRTGKVLYARDPHRRLPPASTTKMMTAILAAEALPLDALVPISLRASRERGGSAIGLNPGEWWTVDDLLHAMLIHSANDAAVALAEAVSGSVEAFAVRMNARARLLGARDTHFVTPNGRYDPQHFSSAYDLALIARTALANPVVARIVSLRTWTLLRPHADPRLLINTNRLLWRLQGADGVKTGWVAESGPCLVASATRQHRRLIAVLLDAPRVFSDAARLLEFGFTGSP
ncbi:MAG TPA: D-alanyl-D-alanine carboxypeptidase family protein [bacterium]